MAENLPGPPCLIGGHPSRDLAPSVTKAAGVGLVPRSPAGLFFFDERGQERNGKGPCLCCVTVPRGSRKQVTTIRWLEM